MSTASSPCPLCSHSAPEGYECAFPNILKCPECGFIFADPAWVVENPASYEEDFASHTRHPTYAKIDGEYVIRNEGKLTALLDSMRIYKTSGKILDVGCSAAFFLKLAQRLGWDPRGVEVSEFGASFSRTKLGIDVFHGTLEEAAFPDDTFDVVFSSHVMEHIDRPLALLEEMKRVTRPGGAIVTVIPTQFSSPAAKFWDDLYGDGPPRHVSFYTRKTYNELLRRAGLRVVKATHNIELDRLRQLLRHGKVGDAGSATHPDSVDGGGGTDRPSPSPRADRKAGYGKGIRFLKSVINAVATPLGVGDELVSVAVKP